MVSPRLQAVGEVSEAVDREAARASGSNAPDEDYRLVVSSPRPLLRLRGRLAVQIPR